jgi:hypothetical protein
MAGALVCLAGRAGRGGESCACVVRTQPDAIVSLYLVCAIGSNSSGGGGVAA